MYDLEKLSWRVEEKRKRFKMLASFYSIAVLLGVAFIIFGNGKDLRLVLLPVGCILLGGGIWLLIRLVGKYSPSVLFSPDVRGVCVKEHEYVATSVSVFGTGNTKGVKFRNSGGGSNAGNARSRRPHVRAAAVYVRLESGDVVILDGLTSVQTDIYEIGDELLRPSGARYPIILNRNVEKQPCPLCGRINSRTDLQCERCGLGILITKNK